MLPRRGSSVGIRTSDGVEHHLDCIVFATGYDVHLTGPPYPITGLGGRSINEEWADGAQAYKSINAHGYPNLFFMTGPNSGPGHNSLLVYVEGHTTAEGAIKRAKAIKSWPRRWKINLIEKDNPECFDLYRRFNW